MSNSIVSQEKQAFTQLQPGHLDDRLKELQEKLRKDEAERTKSLVSVCRWLSCVLHTSISPLTAFAFNLFLQAKVKKSQDELSRLFRECPNRPRDTVAEIDERIT